MRIITKKGHKWFLLETKRIVVIVNFSNFSMIYDLKRTGNIVYNLSFEDVSLSGGMLTIHNIGVVISRDPEFYTVMPVDEKSIAHALEIFGRDLDDIFEYYLATGEIWFLSELVKTQKIWRSEANRQLLQDIVTAADKITADRLIELFNGIDSYFVEKIDHYTRSRLQ